LIETIPIVYRTIQYLGGFTIRGDLWMKLLVEPSEEKSQTFNTTVQFSERRLFEFVTQAKCVLF